MFKTRHSLLAATALLISSPGHAQEAIPDLDTLRALTSKAIVSIKRVPETGPEAIAFYVGQAMNEVPSSDYLDALISDAAASDTLEPSDIAQQPGSAVPTVAASITNVVREATAATDTPVAEEEPTEPAIAAVDLPSAPTLSPALPAQDPPAIAEVTPQPAEDAASVSATEAAPAAEVVEVAETTPAADVAASTEDTTVVTELVEATEEAEVPQRTYVVAQGDSLASIALEFYGDPQEYQRILEANRGIINSADSISIGQALIIPE